MKPSLGRIVHWRNFVDRDLCAVVTAVTPQGDVTLRVMDPNDSADDFTVWSPPFSEVPTEGCWSWPPRV